MISFEEALKIIREQSTTLGIEKVDFNKSVGRVLASNIYSDVNMPPFDKAAMDGYACRKQDLANQLEVIEIIPAGKFPKKEIGKNQCAKIMTGAPVPKGADTVIMVEYTEKVGENTIRFKKDSSKSNICYLAEDVKVGDLVLEQGTIIQPKHIPVLASAGAVKIDCYKQPRVAIVSTGNELVEPNEKPDKSQIRNSNAYQIVAQVEELGLTANYIGIAKDTKQNTAEMMEKAINDSDIIIMSGAVSMGDFDFVPIVLKEKGFNIHFHGIEVKPGKKTVFATKKNKYFVGVPGNPVSSFVQFEMLIKPLIYNIMGVNGFETKLIKLPLKTPYKRKKASRKSFEPVLINKNGEVEKLEYHGSAHINSLSYATGLMIVEKGVTALKKGDLVDVRPI